MTKIITNSDGLVVYAFGDGRSVTIGSDKITVGADSDAVKVTTSAFRVQDLNSSNSTLHTGVTLPNDYVGGRYIYNGSSWSVDPSYRTNIHCLHTESGELPCNEYIETTSIATLPTTCPKCGNNVDGS